MSKRLLFLVYFIIVAIVSAVYYFYPIKKPEKIPVVFFVSPINTEVSLNGTVIDITKEQTFPPGEYSFEFKYQDFDTQSKSLSLITGMEQQSIAIALEPKTTQAQELLKTNEEVLARETVGGQILSEPLDDPIVGKLTRQLPFISKDFRIDYGVSVKYPGDGVAIYISANDPLARGQALDWIRSRGMDPTDFEFVFRSYKEAGKL